MRLALVGPAAQPPHRTPPVASAAQRLAMAELAIRGLPGLRVDDRELQRGGLSYTVLTLESLRTEFGTSGGAEPAGRDTRNPAVVGARAGMRAFPVAA